ncbi:MAG TPA: class I SAM-dependent methyltransferase [Gaiellaceae bacterium]
MPDPRTQIVADGYVAMGEAFAAWREEIVGARVLVVGCGGGTPETRRLVERFALTGVDISPRQVERAPETPATFQWVPAQA